MVTKPYLGDADSISTIIKTYHKNGQIEQLLYTNMYGYNSGPNYIYDSLGYLILMGNFISDVAQGKTIWFSKYGFPQTDVYYENGKIVKSYHYKHCGLLYKKIDHVKGDTVHIDSVQDITYSLGLETVAVNGKSPDYVHVRDTIIFKLEVLKSRYTEHTVIVGVSKDTADVIYRNDGFVSIMDNYALVDTMRYNMSSGKHEHPVILDVDPGKYNFEFTLIDYAKDSSNCESTGRVITVDVLPARAD